MRHLAIAALGLMVCSGAVAEVMPGGRELDTKRAYVYWLRLQACKPTGLSDADLQATRFGISVAQHGKSLQERKKLWDEANSEVKRPSPAECRKIVAAIRRENRDVAEAVSQMKAQRPAAEGQSKR